MNIEGMSDEQKRIRIAEACGWKRAPEFDYVLASPIYRAGERMEMMCKDGDIRAMEELPDYLNDLNAMHEVEKTLSESKWDEYGLVLSEQVDCTVWVRGFISGYGITRIAHATARHRAEAFLLTLPEPEQEAK